MTEFPEAFSVNIREPIDNAIDYMVGNWGGFFDAISRGLRAILVQVRWVVDLVPWWLLLLIVFLITLKLTRKPFRAALYTAMLLFVGMIGLWSMMYATLTIIITSVIFALLLGFPLGVLVSFSDRASRLVRPLLDTMQTMPSFVYLIPAVMLLGLGNVPAVVATVIYAMPPIVRMTSHGIRHVDKEVVEAAQSFGSTRSQLLFKVLIPQAMPTIMTGVNQTIMMAISMVVTCSMIGATGLGSEVLMGINRLESGRGFAAGIALVIVAIVIDRLTQGAMKGEDTHAEA
ncbi:MAG: ABC transporter permease subunit [Eubacteriales bacterium]|jgi:glycine betaine/proline transport system permease protein/glycine betaine/proline transport system substrate-binding protein|nr:ABC transporter permease subunit [Eubacteriales bacterium]MDD3571639.1 ABC transporter permease subunit [Eubacteriales bacterium]MDD4134624.1 ABC transporter permease subunit [Eubacteriales bacterium]